MICCGRFKAGTHPKRRFAYLRVGHQSIDLKDGSYKLCYFFIFGTIS